MSLLKLKSASVILIEDDANKNILPVLLDLVPVEKNVTLFSYEQPTHVWRNIFPNVQCHEEFKPILLSEYTSFKCTVIITSINQMALCLGWNECLKNLKKLSSHTNIEKLILVLHKDCLSHSSKLQIHLNSIATATVSYDTSNPRKVHYRIRKGTKVTKSDEMLAYDSRSSTLTSTPIVREAVKEDEPEKLNPGSLTTFKIEVDQIEKMEKSKLKLPYMSKIHEGESKVYYEPDAVDDWDEEDPDEDLDL